MTTVEKGSATMKTICMFALVAVTMVACVEPPDDTAAVRQAISGGLSLSMSASDRDKTTSDSAAKLYIHGVKAGSIIPQSVTVVTTETTANSRLVNSYDVNSVMHYPQCRPSGTGGYRQTALDFAGAVSLYGAP
jgi:hypothetical protein